MATAAEVTFYQAVSTANQTRQQAYATAFAAYGFVPANLATYRAALVAADVAYVTACNSAASTASISPSVVPEEQGSFGPSASATIAT